MGSSKVNEDTFIRHLPYSTTQKLATFLDPGKLWEQFASNVPKKLTMLDGQSSEFEPKFSVTSVAIIEERCRKPGSSCTRTILSEWSTQNARVKHLVKVLTMSRLYAAADYLTVDIMKGEPVPRSGGPSDNSQKMTELNNSLKSPNTPQKENVTPLGRENDSGTKEGETFYQRKFQCEHSSSQSDSMPESTMNEALMSHASGMPSADLKCDNISSGRIAIESDEVEDIEGTLQQLVLNDDFQLRQLDYNLLRHITNDFNDTELEKGGNLVGRGGFGTVYLGQFTTGFKIAVKCLKEENDDNLKQFTTELQVLAKYRHVNIVHLLGYSQEDANHCLIYQYMPNGSLEDRLACRHNTSPLNCQMRVNIAQGTGHGIEYLNTQGVVHRDIKSANVLLDKDFIPKVGDFATARTAPKGIGTTCVQTSLVIGTSAYLAPEALHFDVSAKLDSYSFGVVLLELLTGLAAYDDQREDKDIKTHMDENCEDVMDMVDTTAGSWREEVALALLDIANRCLEMRKKKRPLVETILPELDKLSNESHA